MSKYPKGWKTVKLGTIAEFFNGKPLEGRVVPDGNSSLITLDSIDIKGQLKKSHKKLNADGDFLKAGDIVTVLSDIAHGYLLGLSALIPADNHYVLNQRMGLLRTSSEIDPSFLRLFINFNQSYFRERGQGTSQRHIYKRDFYDFDISYPPLDEQKAIARALSELDLLIEGIKEELYKKKSFKIALTQEFLSKAIGSNVILGDHAEFSKGNGLPKSALIETGRRKAIHYGELFTHYPEKIKQIKSRTNVDNLGVVISKVNDVLMPTSDVTPNGLATASCIMEDGVALGGDILIVRTDPNLIDGTYLSYVIRNSKDKVLKLVNGTTVYHLYGKDLSNFEFSMPAINQQRESVEVLEILAEEISLLDSELMKYEFIKQGMTHDLLTGEVRLV
jgi:type I restriction enzyme S subunit